MSEDAGTEERRTVSRCRPGHGRNLSGCTYDHDTLDGTDFHGANLHNASFVGTSLTGADFHSANLSGANLTDADLTDAHLHGASLAGAVFCHTIMPDGTSNDTGCP